MVKKVSKENTQKIQEMQIAEQSIQNLLVQKQVFQLELAETNNALEELKKSEGDTFKIVGNLMIKTNKADLEKELTRKKDLINLRIKSMEKQEKNLGEQLTKTRDEVLKKLK
jgi:prefoldin beta subunit